MRRLLQFILLLLATPAFAYAPTPEIFSRIELRSLTSPSVNTATNGTHFTCFDGNGNVAGLVNANTGASSATFEHDPFGNSLGAFGPMASDMPLLFSTKYFDVETGSYYYGYRYMRDGRWMSRDPMEELGGANLYVFVGNSPIGYFDADGRFTLSEWGSIYVAYLEGLGEGAGNVGESVSAVVKSPYTITKGVSTAAGHLSTEGGRDEALKWLRLANQLISKYAQDECFRQRVNEALGAEAKDYFTDPHKLSKLFADVGVAAATAGFGAWAKTAEGAEKLAKLAKILNVFSKDEGAQILTILTRGELARTLKPGQRDLLQQLFGQGPEGARKALELIRNGGQLPEGLTRESLEIYAEIARKSIAEGIDKIGTQAERLRLIEEALKKL